MQRLSQESPILLKHNTFCPKKKSSIKVGLLLDCSNKFQLNCEKYHNKNIADPHNINQRQNQNNLKTHHPSTGQTVEFPTQKQEFLNVKESQRKEIQEDCSNPDLLKSSILQKSIEKNSNQSKSPFSSEQQFFEQEKPKFPNLQSSSLKERCCFPASSKQLPYVAAIQIRQPGKNHPQTLDIPIHMLQTIHSQFLKDSHIDVPPKNPNQCSKSACEQIQPRNCITQILSELFK